MSPNIRGRRARRGSRRLARRDLGWLIALGAAVPVLVTGYYLALPGARSARPAADVGNVLTGTIQAGTTPPGGPAVGGWGEGGYPMVAGSAAGEPGAGEPGSATGEPGASEPGASGQAGHVPGAGAAAVTNTLPNVASANWAGYAATGAAGSFTSVSASWAQSAVTCGAASTFSSFWVGLDGDGTPTVEQTGTEADCAHGAASYQGWYEIFPNAPVFFPDPVQPGDAMSASVVSSGGGTFTLTLSDATQGWTQTTQQAEAAAQLGSAEVIAEAPSNGTVLPLADFGTVDFTGAAVDNAPIGDSANLSEITMESAGGAALATPSALAGGSAFSVTADTGAPAAADLGSLGSLGSSGSLGSGGGGGGASDGGGRRHHHHVLGF